MSGESLVAHAWLTRRSPPSTLNTPGGTRTRNLRIWNPLLYQLSYRRSNRAQVSGHREEARRFFAVPCPLIPYFLFTLCSVCLRVRGQYLLRPSLRPSGMPPLWLTSVR